ncbi:MAG: hypothetical protein OXG39_02240 [Chloroflexi bacterium]|nr:hypothetical protein [Chloroflexota bacterium]
MTSDPKVIIALHEQAMDWADKARSARRERDDDKKNEFMQKAFELEKQAALMIQSQESEPTRSVLHRSAASLAYKCKKYREAEWLVSRALAGNPPGEIMDELRRLNRKIYFQLRMQDRDVALSEQEFSMKLDGNEILNGLAPVDLVTHRISKLKKIFWNTIRQWNGLEFGSSARVNEQSYTLWVSAFEPGSLDVVLKLGISGQMPFSNMGGFDTIFGRVMTSFSLLNDGQFEKLQQHIDNDEYYCNFVALAKEIAPDGDDVVNVNLGALVEGQRRQVNLVRQQQEFTDVRLPDLLPPSNGLHAIDEFLTLRGELQFADGRTKHKQVKLDDTNSGKSWTIFVAEALMKDVVQPHFGEQVEIVGKRMARKKTLPTTLYLTEIRKL